MRALDDYYEKNYPEFVSLRTKCKEILQVDFLAKMCKYNFKSLFKIFLQY